MRRRRGSRPEDVSVRRARRSGQRAENCAFIVDGYTASVRTRGDLLGTAPSYK